MTLGAELLSYQKLQSAQACPSCRQQIWGAMSWSHSSTPVPGVRIAPGAPELGVLCCSSSYAGSELQRCSDGPKRAAPARAGTGGSSRKSTFPAWCRQQLPGTERCAKTCAFLLWCFLSEVHGGVLDVILLWSRYIACIHVPEASCSRGTGGWRMSPGPQGCGAYCSHSPAPYDAGWENFSFVDHCNSALFEAPEGKDRGTGDPRYLLVTSSHIRFQRFLSKLGLMLSNLSVAFCLMTSLFSSDFHSGI